MMSEVWLLFDLHHHMAIPANILLIFEVIVSSKKIFEVIVWCYWCI